MLWCKSICGGGKKRRFYAGFRVCRYHYSHQKQLELLLRNVDETHLLYGSDMPYTNLFACFGQMEALENTQKLTEHQKQLMFTDTEPIRADTKSEQHTV